MKIYTKTGDKGLTSLAMGGRVAKSDARVELYGTCDELMSVLGLTNCSHEVLKKEIERIQNLLFELGSELAGFRKQDSDQIILQEDIEFLEQSIDRMQEKLPVLKTFILPGGARDAGYLHLARTVCRRLERGMVRHREEGGEIFDPSLIFINRLSDYLFVAARFSNLQAGIEDVKWYSRAKSDSRETS
ncbi:MAG: cob(I)yrinic acid a,c-diamide adenosyltransferase [Leptospiraceae bacterium]|nr:cob(I)yrinic acid a,c-diamide adenosyltransferase [Leptospiraceae bacterium]